MSKKSINVDRINLRLRGVSHQVARAALSGLSHQIQRQVTQQGLQQPRLGANHIARIDRGSIQVEPGASANGLRRQIAQAIAKSISPGTQKR